MTSLVSLVLNNADRLPIVGSPIGQATSWYNRRNSQEEATTLYDESNILPPPPYEKVPSRLTKISDYVWKRASFSSAVEINPTNKLTPNNNQLKMEPLVHIIDKKHIQDGLTLINIATEMNHSYTQHQQQMSLELYMMGLDKILSSLPIDSDPMVKEALEKKLSDFKNQNNLTLKEEEKEEPLSEQQKEKALDGLSELIINASVLSAIALKKSSLPGYLNSAIQLAKSSMYKVDEVCSIRQRTWNIATYGVAKAAEIDKHYEVHQFFAEAFYTGCTALLKAGIAYSDAPGPSVNKDC